MQENGTDTNPNILKRFITGETREHPGGSAETDNHDTLTAIENIDPDTGQTYWYIKNPDTDERIPISVQKDENDVLRELLPDGSLGREITQDPNDDPMRIHRLTGFAPTPESAAGDLASQSNPFAAETLTAGALPSTATAGETSEPTPANPFAATASNALTSDKTNLSTEAEQAKHLMHQAQTPPASEQLLEKLDSISPLEILRQKRANALKSLDTAAEAFKTQSGALATLNIPNAPNLYDIRTGTLIAETRTKLLAAPDQKSLNLIQSTYFASQDTGKLQTLKQQLLKKPNATTFEAALTEVKTIPEASAIVSYLIQGRSEALEQIKSQGEHAATMTSSTDFAPAPNSAESETSANPAELTNDEIFAQAAVELDGKAPEAPPAPANPLAAPDADAPISNIQQSPHLHILPKQQRPNPNSPEDYLYQNLAA
jgi:hypothetical protein